MSAESAVKITAVQKFIGLSRMTHSILDIAHPAAGALLALGAIPRLSTALLGLGAAFSGFTAVFALNDLIDAKVDAEKMARFSKGEAAFDIDSVGARHPVAQGALSRRAGWAWVIFWGLSALVLAFLLKPVCAILLVAAVALETAYCKLLRVTHWKTVLSGLMVAVGGLAGVYAVTSRPSPGLVILFMLWAALWEIGGRNIPNDWSDMDEDIHLGTRTLPIKLGRESSAHISLVICFLVVACSAAFPLVVPFRLVPLYELAVLLAGLFLLILPALGWLKARSVESGMLFFNRACFYPLAIFCVLGLLAVFVPAG